MKGYRTRGIIIKRRNFGEADRILIIFSKHYGKISVIAKGVRKISSKRGGNLELFNLVDIYLVRGKTWDIVTEVEVRKDFKDLRKNLSKVGRAYYICELVDRLTAERQESEEIFELMQKNLLKIDKNKRDKKLDLIVREFEGHFLIELGFWPKDRSFVNLNTKKFIEEILESKIKSSQVLELIDEDERN